MSVGSHEDESISELNKMSYFIENRDCKEPMKDDPDLEMVPPLMPGEYMRFIGRSCEGILGLTNFRLLQNSETEGQFRVNVPIRMLDAVIGTELFVVLVHTKDAGAIRFNFSTNDMASVWRSRLTDALAPLPSLDAFFAFHFKAFLDAQEYQDFRRIFDSNASDLDLDTDLILKNGACNGEADGDNRLDADKPKWRRPDELRALHDEFRRMAFDEQHWRVSDINRGYRVSETYPEPHVVPVAFEDKDLKEALEYRAAHRFPSVTWRSKRTGAVIARCSQPGTGFFSARNSHDEELLRKIVAACRANRASVTSAVNGAGMSNGVGTAAEVAESSPEPSMLIVDARSYSAAFANRARGYGTELADYYPSCRIEFGNLANIHAVRAAYDALRSAGLTTTSADFQLAVSSSRWLQYVAQLLHCSRIIVDSIEKACPVMIHCSDGWDRTPQLTAIAQVCLDPHYRTVAGFRTLVEREWLAFGHKFADRCGHDTTAHRAHNSERSQVFVQWLDAIFQVVSQFPAAFEYNSYFLKKLAIHANSCLFGTFLLNTSKERADNATIAQTCSVWDYLRPESNWRVLNLLYHEKSAPEVLRPSSCTRDMLLWRDLYCSHWPTADAGDLPSAEPSPANYHLRAAGVVTTASTAPLSTTEEDDAARIGRSRSFDTISTRHEDEGLMMTATSSEVMLSSMSAMISSSDTVVMKPSGLNGFTADQAPLQLPGTHAGRGLSHCASGSSINGSGMQRSFLGASCTSIEALDHSTELFTNVERHLQRQARVLARNREKANSVQSRVNGLSSPPAHFVGLDWDGLPMPSLADCLVVRSLLVQYERQLSVERERRAEYRRRATKAEHDNERLRSDVAMLTEQMRRMQRQLHARSEDGHPALLPSSSPGAGIAPGYFDPSDKLLDQPLALLARNRDVGYLSEEQGRNSLGSSAASDMGGPSETLSSVGSDYVRVNDHDEPQFWQPDHLATECTNCRDKFHYLLRKHHCRKCGLVFCDSCTRYRIAVPEQHCYEPVRVCYNCYESMTDGSTVACRPAGRSPTLSGSSVSSSSTAASSTVMTKCGEASNAKEASNGQCRPNTAYVMG